jgi:hypothetical protein
LTTYGSETPLEAAKVLEEISNSPACVLPQANPLAYLSECYPPNRMRFRKVKLALKACRT